MVSLRLCTGPLKKAGKRNCTMTAQNGNRYAIASSHLHVWKTCGQINCMAPGATVIFALIKLSDRLFWQSVETQIPLSSRRSLIRVLAVFNIRNNVSVLHFPGSCTCTVKHVLKGKGKCFSKFYKVLCATIQYSWNWFVEIHIQKYLPVQKLQGYLNMLYLFHTRVVSLDVKSKCNMISTN